MRNHLVRRFTGFAVAAVAAFTLAACGGAAAITSVDAAAFADQVQTQGVVTLDVRTAEEYAAGHIPGAINIDVEGGDFDAGIAELDPTLTYAVYCRSGRRSLDAANRMSEAGFTKIYNLDGGIIEWSAAGGQLVLE